MKTLLETNPYLQDKEKAKHLNARSVRSSCGVESIVIKTTSLQVKIEKAKSCLVYSKMKERLSKS